MGARRGSPKAGDPHYCAGRRKRSSTQTYNRVALYLFECWVGWPQFITEEGLRFPGRRSRCGGSKPGLFMRAASLIVSRQFCQRHNCYLCPLLRSQQLSPQDPTPSRASWKNSKFNEGISQKEWLHREAHVAHGAGQVSSLIICKSLRQWPWQWLCQRETFRSSLFP